MGSDIFGALFASVSGLDSQSTNLSIIANNIANANTTGYKATQAEFETLVSGAGSSTNFASGGVTANNRQLVDQQGLLQSTSSPTDIAIQGSGLFVVNSNASGSGQVLYTRAGSFTQDSSGNFVNSAGYFLQAWPLDRDGRLPGAPGNIDTTSSANLSSLQTVNVQNVAGKASATTAVSISANLNAGQAAFPGAAGTVTMDKNNTTNFGITANTIIVPDPTIDKIVQGDVMTVSTGQNSAGFTYTYGGIATSRNVTTGAGGDSGNPVQSPGTLGTTNAFIFSASSPTSMTLNNLGFNPTTKGIGTGTVVKIAGTSGNGLAVNNITSLDGEYYVTGTTANSITVTIPANITPPSAMSLTGATFTATTGQTTIAVSGATIPAGMKNGDRVTFANIPGIDASMTSAVLNAAGGYLVSNVNSGAGTFTITTGTNDVAAGAPVTGGATTTMFDQDGDLTAATSTVTSRLFSVSGDILDASSPTAALITTPSNYTTAALSFSITSGTITSTFTYTPAAPNASLGQFSTLDNLAAAINSVTGLSARVVNNQLYIAAIDGTQAITFANGSVTGSNTSPPLGGIDWVGELGLNQNDVLAASNRFSTMQGLANLVNGGNSPGLTATVNNALGAATVTINVNDPLDTIKFVDGSTTPLHTDTGSLLAELGLGASINGGVVAAETAGPFGPAYDPAVSTTNMASGAITPQFSRSITVFDSLGAPHNLNIAFINTGVNSWAVEIYAQPASDITQSSGGLLNGQVATGTLNFNGDGSLESVGIGLSGAIPITWADGATTSSITMNWGTAGAIGTGKTNGMSQFNSAFSVNNVNQNGAPVGALTSISIGTTGLITASFSNGQTQNLYQIPLASFTDPDQMLAISGNVFAQTSSSGQVNLQQIGASSVGTISSSSLEQSNVELADQLTSMIVAQRAYEANTKVISTADTLLSDLDQIIQ